MRPRAPLAADDTARRTPPLPRFSRLALIESPPSFSFVTSSLTVVVAVVVILKSKLPSIPTAGNPLTVSD